MTISRTPPHASMPYKSVAVALLLSALLGPVGLLYGSFWGGVFLIMLGVFFFCNKWIFLLFLIWLTSCIWNARSVESYNKKIARASYPRSA